jgi:pimeloyl-ACP methyl ester carboxylesterase
MGNYVEIVGHPTWVHDSGGTQPPLLLLHGGLAGSESGFETVLPSFEKTHRVVMFDRRGHGRTADTDAPFDYAAMAVETAGVIDALDLAPVHVIGYSDGGNLLLHLARNRPELITAMVLMSANFRADALNAAVVAGLEAFALTEGGPLLEAYTAQTPDGAEHWPEVVAKTITMFTTQPTFTPAELGTITTPTLVLASDDDIFPVSHSVALYEALPNAQLAIVPGTSHLHLVEKPDLVARLVNDFLAAPGPAATFLPVRRAGH